MSIGTLAIILLALGVVGVLFSDSNGWAARYHDNHIVLVDSLVWVTIIIGMILSVIAFNWWSIGIILGVMFISSTLAQSRRRKIINEKAREMGIGKHHPD